jgi:hypothetical protein
MLRTASNPVTNISWKPVTPIRTTQIKDYLAGLNAPEDRASWGALVPLANLTALRREEPDGYFISNFWRGPLLYSLVKSLELKNVLELGTGRGYAALAMVQAALDNDLDTKIWSVDSRPTTENLNWHYDAGSGATTEPISLEKFWATHISSNLTDRISVLTGDCADVANLWPNSARPPVDLVFIDAGHTYADVKRDFLAALNACTPNAMFVFDDYGDRSDYGVKKLVDQYLPLRVDSSEIQVIEFQYDSAYDRSRDHKMAIWTPLGEARPEIFRSFMNLDQLLMSSLRQARRTKSAVRRRLLG